MNALCRLSIVPIVLLSVAQARGNTITEPAVSFSFAGFDVATGDSEAIPMPVFNTALGTLNAVTIQVSGTETFSVPLAIFPIGPTLPDPGSPNPILIGLEFGVGVNFAQIPAAAGGSQQIIWNATAAGYPAFGSGVGVVSGSFADDPTLYTDPSNPPQVIIGAYGGTDGVVSGDATSFATDDADADMNGTLTATFDYTPGDPPAVPEPAGLTLLGVGLLGMSATRLRRGPPRGM